MSNEFESILKKLKEQSQKDIDIKGYIYKSIDSFDEFLKEFIDDLSKEDEASQSNKNQKDSTSHEQKEKHTSNNTEFFDDICKNIEKVMSQLNETFSVSDELSQSSVIEKQKYKNIHNEVVETICQTLNEIIEFKDKLLPNIIYENQQSFNLLRELFTNLSILQELLMEYRIDDNAIVTSHNKYIKDIFNVLNQFSNNYIILKKEYPLLSKRYEVIIQNIIHIDKQIKELDKLDA